jgi:hypothetical protein
VEQRKESYYDDPKYNIAFERCIDVMSRLIMKYGPALLDKMEQESLEKKIMVEVEPYVKRNSFSGRMLGFYKLMTKRAENGA